MPNTLIDDYYQIIEDNGFQKDEFEITYNNFGQSPYYYSEIKVSNKNTGRKKIYIIRNGEPGWTEFEDDIKTGYFV